MTEHSVERYLCVTSARDALERIITEHSGHGFEGVMRPAGVGCAAYVAAYNALQSLRETSS